jgi:putative transposase
MDRIVLTRPNQSWGIDFLSDVLLDGRKFRALTVVHNHTRECLAIEVAKSLTGDDVVRMLTNIAKERH